MNRPGLAAAVDEARGSGAIILVADMSRLSRNADRFKVFKRSCKVSIESLISSETANARSALAAVERAGEERLRKSLATKDDLRNRKAKGKALGNRASLPLARRNSQVTRKVGSDDTAREIREFLEATPGWESWSVNVRLERLNSAGKRTSRGKPWTVGALKEAWRKALEELKLQNEPDQDGMVVPDNRPSRPAAVSLQATSGDTRPNGAFDVAEVGQDNSKRANATGAAETPPAIADEVSPPRTDASDPVAPSQDVTSGAGNSPFRKLASGLRSAAVRIFRSTTRLLRARRSAD